MSERGLVRARGVLSDVDCFDARLFRLTPAQAQMLDPQQRVWLECVHRAMEDAGLPVGGSEERDGANIGVFAGGRESSYLWHLVGGDRRGVEALLTGSADDALELQNSNDRDSIATRTSYLLGFTGPSINVQTACSTSLVAVAQACQALVSRHCDVAIAGGVAVTFPQRRGHRHQAGGLYSRDGHCRPFDADASGTVFSDGVGVVVLKRLEQARADGDRIDAVIRGWAVNNDGANKASFTAPSVQGQARVIAQAQDHAGVRPHEISYVEAHGTGTPVGDPIEFAAFDRAFRRDTDARGFCGLGSVKSNIGHADTAAGIAGLIKTILALKHGELPATLHYRRPNPEIDVPASPFYVVDRLRAWTTDGSSRIAGVSSLGVGGTNCHVIVAEAPALDEADAALLPAYLVPLSAASPEALEALAASFREFVSSPSCPDLARIAATAQRHRAHHAVRLAIRCASLEQLHAGLSGDPSRDAAAPVRQSALRHVDGSVEARQRTSRRLVLCSRGQGSQHVGMGRALFEVSPEFRRLLQSCDRLLRSHLDRPLLDVMFNDADDGASILRTEFAQPALFALEYSLAELLRTWGITPRFVIGHSLGEYVAACVAGVFPLEEGLVLAAARGRLMQGLPGRGGMRAVAAGPDAIEPLLRRFAPEVSIAAINSPTQTVLSGDLAALEQLGADLRSRGIRSRALSVSHAFHSAQMDPAMQPLAELFGRIHAHSAALATHQQPDRDCGHRRGHRSPVLERPRARTGAVRRGHRDADSGRLRDAGRDWPRRVAVSFDRRPSVPAAALTPSRRCNVASTTGTRCWRRWLGCMSGAPASIGRRFRPVGPRGRSGCRPIRFSGRVTGTRAPSSRPRPMPRRPLPQGATLCWGSDCACPGPRRFASKRASASCRRTSSPTIDCSASHSRRPRPISRCWPRPRQSSPGAESERAAPFRFEAIHLLRPLLLPDGVQRDVQLICRPASPMVGASSSPAPRLETTARRTASGRLTWSLGDWPAGERSAPDTRWDLETIRASCERRVSGAEFYANVWANQGGTGSSFRWIESIWQGDRVALCRAACPGRDRRSIRRIACIRA